MEYLISTIGKLFSVLSKWSLCFFLLTCISVTGQCDEKIKIRFIENSFENASPLNREISGDTAVKIFLLADYDRESLNRQTDHWYFKVEADILRPCAIVPLHPFHHRIS